MPPRVGQRRSVTIVDSFGNCWTVNSEGRADMVQHAHIDSTNCMLEVSSIGGVTGRYILVDLSNTSSWHHKNTNYVHIENIDIQTDAVANAAYSMRLGFLDNVDATDGDFIPVWGVSGSKGTGQSKDIFVNWYPNGAKCKSDSTISNNITRNDSFYQTDVNLPSIFDVTTADTPSGNNDLVLEVSVTANQIGFNFSFSYHTH